MSKCKDCRFWQQDKKAGDCRRHPPRIIVFSDEEGDYETRFPETFPTEWCGEFQPKEDINNES